jgi:hypothetical protein
MDRLRAVYTAAFFAESRGLGIGSPLAWPCFRRQAPTPAGLRLLAQRLDGESTRRAPRAPTRKSATDRDFALRPRRKRNARFLPVCRHERAGRRDPNRVPQPCTSRCSRRPELTALRGSTTLRGARQTGRLPPAARENSHLFCLEERAQHLLSA